MLMCDHEKTAKILREKNIVKQIKENVEICLPLKCVNDYILYIVCDNLWLVSSDSKALDLSLKAITAVLDVSPPGIKQSLYRECKQLADVYTVYGYEKSNIARVLNAVCAMLRTPTNPEDTKMAVLVVAAVCGVTLPRHVTEIRTRALDMLFDLGTYPGAVDLEADPEAAMKRRDEQIDMVLAAINNDEFKQKMEYNVNGFSGVELYTELQKHIDIPFGSTRHMHRVLLSVMPEINNMIDDMNAVKISYSKPYASGHSIYKIEIDKQKVLDNIIDILSEIKRESKLNASNLYKEFCVICKWKGIKTIPFGNKNELKSYLIDNWEAVTEVVDIEFKRPYKTQAGKYYIGCASRCTEEGTRQC